MQDRKRENTKLSPLYIMAEKVLGVSIYLNIGADKISMQNIIFISTVLH